MIGNNTTKDDEYGVLLYYKYTKIPNLDDLFTFYNSNCTSLSLLGRVRLAPHGVNVTIGGKLSALHQHITALISNNHLFKETDFKLATCNEPINNKVAEECGFTSLSIRIVQELVTLSSHPLPNPPEISKAGTHLSALEFHSVLQTPNSDKIVLLDARNLYETRIGKFQAQNVETLDPEIRQYSDLPSWVDSNSEKLRGNQILMYCTGGIRCEMASAYIKSKGPGFENVFQLYGGIQRYMEQFPDGGFFKGKNFVFDHRVSVSSSDSRILGKCLVCEYPFDDYSSRTRCSHCRMLVLVCHACTGKDSYICELCQKFSNDTIYPPQISRKLRILCLHGFRQNTSSFKGRTASFAKKLKNIAEFVYIDAPHPLRFIYKKPDDVASKTDDMASKTDGVAFIQQPQQPKACNRKFAWFIDPDSDVSSKTDDWEVARVAFDSRQYERQGGGFDESYAYVKEIVAREGPFDGVLGFSQGAAMAACVALKGDLDLRFVILCSGFYVDLGERERGLIKCPSLHIYGSDVGKDRQIGVDASRRLASMFEEGCLVTVEHDCGHIIPTRSPYIDTIKDFLQRFL